MNGLTRDGRPLGDRARAGMGYGGPRRGIVALVLVLSALFAPRFAAAQTAADSTLVLGWTATGDDGLSGRATTYQCRYRTTPIVGTDTLTWWNAATPVTGLPSPGVSGTADSVRVRGLNPLTTYYFIIRLADEVPNWSGYSNLLLASTSGDLTPPGAITTLLITGSTGTTIALRWSAPGNNGSTGTAASYDIRYSTSPITAANFGSATQAAGEPAPAVAGTVQTYTLAGLLNGTTYYVAMKATDSAGNVSVISNVVNGATLDVLAPAAITDLSARP